MLYKFFFFIYLFFLYTHFPSFSSCPNNPKYTRWQVLRWMAAAKENFADHFRNQMTLAMTQFKVTVWEAPYTGGLHHYEATHVFHELCTLAAAQIKIISHFQSSDLNGG